jgi:hypothetical protein
MLTSELAHNGNTTELLVDLMQMFRDKSAIFNLSCELLIRLTKCQPQIKVCLPGIWSFLSLSARLSAKRMT